MQAFREFKAAWDPDNRMNPNKGAVDARPPTEDLRLGADYKPWQPNTHFKFPDDGGSFANASLRCIGVGECRKNDYGTMCPSFMATREEEHSTRGRARLLFEMLQGEVLPKDWTNESVKRGLDLCLSCKACKSECPTNVDIATYRAEFLSHYYETRRRPLHAHAFGRVDRWARMASMAPRLANLVAAAPGIAQVIRRALHIAPERELPTFAPVPFRSWARAHGVPDVGGVGGGGTATRGSATGDRQVILWADTFNNYFHPHVSQAALEVLQSAGFTVTVPGQHLCCGRPLYDFGFLDLAVEYLRTILDVLKPAIESGVPIVVLEPSCASVFRDELRNLLPDDARANQLRKQVFLLSEFLQQRAPDYAPPSLNSKVLLHGHCHHKAVMKMTDEESLLRRMGADCESLDAGCCGMAGPFGFTKDRYEVAQAIGEKVLLPAVRRAASDTLIVSDGFSCQEQIRQSTGRQAVHLAEALQAALRSR
jgi:Fe-S oxidoreductase